MVAFDWKRELDRRDNQVVLSGQPIAIHCHHYNINLQKTLEDTLGQEGYPPDLSIRKRPCTTA